MQVWVNWCYYRAHASQRAACSPFPYSPWPGPHLEAEPPVPTSYPSSVLS